MWDWGRPGRAYTLHFTEIAIFDNYPESVAPRDLSRELLFLSNSYGWVLGSESPCKSSALTLWLRAPLSLPAFWSLLHRKVFVAPPGLGSTVQTAQWRGSLLLQERSWGLWGHFRGGCHIGFTRYLTGGACDADDCYGMLSSSLIIIRVCNVFRL